MPASLAPRFTGRRSLRPRPPAAPGTSFHRASFFLVLAFKFLPWNQLTLHVVRKISKVQEGGLLLLGLLCEETDVLSLLKSAHHLLRGECLACHPAQGPAGPLPVPGGGGSLCFTNPASVPSSEEWRACCPRRLGLLQWSTETGDGIQGLALARHMTGAQRCWRCYVLSLSGGSSPRWASWVSGCFDRAKLSSCWWPCELTQVPAPWGQTLCLGVLHPS